MASRHFPHFFSFGTGLPGRRQAESRPSWRSDLVAGKTGKGSPELRTPPLFCMQQVWCTCTLMGDQSGGQVTVVRETGSGERALPRLVLPIAEGTPDSA